MSLYNTVGNIRIRKGNNVNINRLRNNKRRKLLSYYNAQLSNYIFGLLHPENSVTGSEIPKCPNYVSIPTSNITFREAFDIDPDKNGEFVLCWTPNFLATEDRIKYMTNGAQTDYTRNWLGGFSEDYNEYGFYPIAAYKPPASFRKYRLVSAGCKISYKGPIIERAGIVSHCLSYRQFPMVMFKEDDSDFLSLEVFKNNLDPRNFGTDLDNYETTTIQNGMWNQVKNVQKGEQVFVISVPTDPSDFIFEDDGFFYASASADDRIQTTSGNWNDGNNVPQTYSFSPQLAEDGTPCSYIFKGTNLTKDAKLYVEQFYNFEVIPTEESATILRPRKNSFTSSELELSKEVINKSLELTKGQSSKLTKNVINKLISDESIGDMNNQITNQINTKVNTVLNKQLNNLKNDIFNQNNKQIAYDTMKNSLKSGFNKIKNVGKKVVTKENIKFATELLAAFLSKKGK